MRLFIIYTLLVVGAISVSSEKEGVVIQRTDGCNSIDSLSRIWKTDTNGCLGNRRTIYKPFVELIKKCSKSQMEALNYLGAADSIYVLMSRTGEDTIRIVHYYYFEGTCYNRRPLTTIDHCLLRYIKEFKRDTAVIGILCQ